MRRGPGVAAMASLLTLGLGGGPGAETHADLVLTGGAVYTLDAARTWARAVAIRGGRIVYVGTEEGAKGFAGASTRVLDLDGKMVLPGFHDAHVHPVSSGVDLARCDLTGLKTREAVLDAVRNYAREHPKEPWVLGSGWDLPVFPDANPTRQELDRVVPDRPAYLTAADGHSAWVNTRALEVAGITRETPDPPNGRIERDVAGNPSGTLREAASSLVSRHVPPSTREERLAGLARALELAARFGITSLYEANADEPTLEAYADFDGRGKLTARVAAAISVDEARGPEQVPELSRLRARYTRGRLRAVGAKIFVDGVIEARTAALLEPYVDQPAVSGRPIFEPAALSRLAIALDAAGFQIHLHAIGDRAIRMALDALGETRRVNGPRDARPLLAHLELIHPSDIPRFRTLGAIADFQPLWAYADPYIRDLTLPKLGPERSRWLYPIGSVARSGGALAAGSDWNVSSLNPLEAIQIAVTRRDPEDPAAAVFLPEERVDLPTILAAYTIGGAYAFGQEKETGSIEAGKAADLVVLDRNLFEVPPGEIGRVRVVRTFLSGQEIFREGGSGTRN